MTTTAAAALAFNFGLGQRAARQGKAKNSQGDLEESKLTFGAVRKYGSQSIDQYTSRHTHTHTHTPCPEKSISALIIQMKMRMRRTVVIIIVIIILPLLSTVESCTSLDSIDAKICSLAR